MRTVIIVLVGLAIVMMGTVGAIEVAYQEEALGSQPTIETNGTFTPEHATTHDFADSNVDDYVYVGGGDVTVSQDGVSIASGDGENWEWNRDDGTLFVPDGSDLNESQEATVEFGYAESTDAQQLNRDVAMIGPQSGGVFIEVAGGAMLLASIVILARMGGK